MNNLKVETFLNSQHQTRYRILVDGKVTDDLGGIGLRSEERVLNYWYSRKGLPFIKGEDEVKKAKRRAAHLAELKKRAEQVAADKVAEEEAKKKILILLEQRPVWNDEELQCAVGVTDTIFAHALWELEKVEHSNSTVHRKSKELLKLREEARKAVGTHNNAPIRIIPDSNEAPVLTGEGASGYNRIKWGGYNPSTLLVTVGQHWLSPVVEAIAEDYKYDA
jgi:hypothetical protein